MSIGETLRSGQFIDRPRHLLAFSEGEKRRAEANRSAIGQMWLDSGVDAIINELVESQRSVHPDIKVQPIFTDSVMEDDGSVKRIGWNYGKNYSIGIDFDSVAIVAHPLTRELFIEGSMEEVLTEGQWRDGSTLEDAIARMYTEHPAQRYHLMYAD